MNFAQLNTLVLSWLDDPNGTYFTLPQVNVWLNNATKECQRQLVQAGENFYVRKVSSSMVVDQTDYPLPNDFLNLSKLEIVTSGSGVTEVRKMLCPVTLVQLDQVSMSVGEPTAYNIKRNCFSVRPTPQQAYVMYLNYSYEVADMTAPTDIPDVPNRYQEYVAILGALNGYMKDGRDMSQLVAKKDWYLSLMKQDAQQRNIDAPRQVISSDDWDYGMLY